MTEQSWAEGSGSTWESDDGDPRVVPGAEVLLGTREGSPGFVPSMQKFVGRRARVVSVDHTFVRWCQTDCDFAFAHGWNWPVRDLVCLKTADGRLTEEGWALEGWQGLAPGGHRLYSPAISLPEWGVRSGILVSTGGEWYRVDSRRLAMALGREPPTKTTPGVLATELIGTSTEPVPGVEHHCATCVDRMTSSEREPCHACCAAPPVHGKVVYPGWRLDRAAANELVGVRPCGDCRHARVPSVREPCKTCIAITHAGTGGQRNSLWEPPAAEPQVRLAQVFHRVLPPDEVKRVHANAVAGNYSCVSCLRPVSQADIDAGHAAREPYDRLGREAVLCSDCRWQPAHVERLEHREDESASAEMDALRRFIRGPCGRPS